MHGNDPFVLVQVNIQVPAPEQQSDKIAITGLANHLDRAKEGLLERVKELQAEQEDRVSILLIAGRPRGLAMSLAIRERVRCEDRHHS